MSCDAKRSSNTSRFSSRSQQGSTVSLCRPINCRSSMSSCTSERSAISFNRSSRAISPSLTSPLLLQTSTLSSSFTRQVRARVITAVSCLLTSSVYGGSSRHLPPRRMLQGLQTGYLRSAAIHNVRHPEGDCRQLESAFPTQTSLPQVHVRGLREQGKTSLFSHIS